MYDFFGAWGQAWIASTGAELVAPLLVDSCLSGAKQSLAAPPGCRVDVGWQCFKPLSSGDEVAAVMLFL